MNDFYRACKQIEIVIKLLIANIITILLWPKIYWQLRNSSMDLFRFMYKYAPEENRHKIIFLIDRWLDILNRQTIDLLKFDTQAYTKGSRDLHEINQYIRKLSNFEPDISFDEHLEEAENKSWWL